MGPRVAVYLCILSLAWGVTFATQATERSAQTLEVKLYPMSTSDWTSTKTTSFATAIATAATTYCTASPSSCNLDTGATFTSAEVGEVSTSDQSKSMTLQFYVDLPSTATVSAGSSLQFVLPSSVLEIIAENARDEIKTSTDAYVTYVGTTYLGIPIDSTTNAIIIPIAVLIVLVVAVVTVCLVKWQTKKEREERQLKRQMKKTYGTSGSSDAPPNYNILETTNTTFVSGATTTPRHGNGNKVVPDDYSSCVPAKMTSPSRPPPKVTEFREEEEGEHDPAPLGRNGLAPLYPSAHTGEEQLLEGEAERQERRRKKKERKREKRRVREEMEMHDNQGMDTSGLTDTETNTSIPTFTVHRGNAVA